MLVISAEAYDSFWVVAYQRATVIFTDLMLFIATWRFTQSHCPSGYSLQTLAITLFNGGLLIVDHIHFQYNGFLLGLLVLSLTLILEDRPILGGIVFAILLNFKHIYVYMAPPIAIYLFRAYCLTPSGKKNSFLTFVGLGVSVIVVCAISMGPFLYMGQLSQVVSRLFPFKRGLVHAYWAPNAWALYTLADRVLSIGLRLYGVPVTTTASFSTGIVGAGSQSVLPDVPPLATFIVTGVTMLPALISLWNRPSKGRLIPILSICTMCSFMFGWHVHEKAILMVTIPLGLFAVSSPQFSDLFVFLSAIANFSQMPLLFTPAETPIKCFIVLFHSLLCYLLVNRKERLHWLYVLYYLGLTAVLVFSLIIHPLFIFPKNEFLPLLITSCYCAVGVTFFWIKFYYHISKI